MAHIVIAINTSWNVWNFRAGLVRALVADGHRVTALCPRDDYSDRLAELGARHVTLRLDSSGVNPLVDARLFFRYRSKLRLLEPDVFLGWTVKPNVWGSLAAHSLGVAVINNVSGLGTAFIRDTWLTAVVRRLYRAGLAAAPVTFFQNGDDRALFVEGGLVAAGRTAVLPGSGVDLARFAPAPMPEGPPAFLLVGRVLRDKGVAEYAGAARIVRAARPDAQFRLLGTLDALNRTAIPRATVEGWVAEGLVDYRGETDDVRPHLAAAHCVVLPSYRDGTPRTLLEAAATGRPLIATDVPGCREPVEPGRNGLLARVRDPADLARAMGAFLDLSDGARAAMGRESRLIAQARFDERLVLDAYRGALAGIAAAR